MRKIKQLSFVLFIFFVLALSYPVTPVSAKNSEGYKGRAPQCPPGQVFVTRGNSMDPNRAGACEPRIKK